MKTTAAPTMHAQGVAGFLNRVVTTSLGAKLVMAVTGVIVYGWLILHLLGNLTVFGGQELMNAYAFLLQGNAELLWAQRVVLITALLIHIVSGIRLASLNRRARPQPYAMRQWRAASFASRYMFQSGLVVLAFIVFHILHFTTRSIFSEDASRSYTSNSGVEQFDVYSMVQFGFSHAWVVVIYLIGVGLLGLHLSHGVWSMLQTLGLNGKKFTPFALRAGFVLGVGLVVLFLTIPLAVFLGIVGG